MTAPSLAERALAALDVEFGEQIKLRYRAICARLDGDGSLQNLDAELAGCERGLGNDKAAYLRMQAIIAKAFGS